MDGTMISIIEIVTANITFETKRGLPLALLHLLVLLLQFVDSLLSDLGQISVICGENIHAYIQKQKANAYRRRCCGGFPGRPPTDQSAGVVDDGNRLATFPQDGTFF